MKQNLSRNATNWDITMAWLLQQNLPCTEIPTFNGSPLKWIEFVIKFQKIVHNHVYLEQHVSGIAKRAILGLSSDKRGYILSLKRLKYKFWKKSYIAEAHLTKGLMKFYYSISDCIITLRQLSHRLFSRGSIYTKM